MEAEKRNCFKAPEVKFNLVSRKLSPAQAEAGKRLFKRLVERAQSRINQAPSEESSYWKK